MSKWSDHLSHDETKCKCGCGLNRPSAKLIDRVEVLRAMVNIRYFEWTPDGWVDKPEIKFHVTSCCRCVKHNKNEGGSKNSEHIAIKPHDTEPLGGIGWHGGRETEAIDGFFYYGTDINANRVDVSDVLIYAWECKIINGLILYKKNRYHIGVNRRYKSYKDLRGE